MRTYRVVFQTPEGKKYIADDIRANSEADAILAAKQAFRDQGPRFKTATATMAIPVTKD